MAPKVETPAVQDGPLATAVLDKYKSAATVVASALAGLIKECVEGASVVELCNKGDKLVEEGVAALYNKVKGTPKGIAFPTSLAVNNIISNFSPVPVKGDAAPLVLAKDDVVKITIGAHIDGYAVVSAETIVVGATEVTEQRAALLAAAHYAGEAALRAVKAGARNWELTDAVKQVIALYESAGVKGVETILSHQHEQNSIEAKKGIVAVPTLQQRQDGDNAFTLEEGEVYGLNVVVTNGDKTPKEDQSRTTIYQKTTATYLLKMKTSRATFTEISKKAGQFPFTLRMLEDESRARFGVQECVQHGLLKPYHVLTTDKTADLSAQSIITFAVTKAGVVRLSAAPSYFSEDKVKSSVELSEEVKAVLAKPLSAKAKKAKKPKAEGEAKAE